MISASWRLPTGGFMLFSPPARRLCLGIVVLSVLASPAWAQKKKLALEDLTAEPSLAGRPAAQLTWLSDGKRFSYVVRRGGGDEATAGDLVVEDARTGQKSVAVSAQSLTLPADPADPVEA